VRPAPATSVLRHSDHAFAPTHWSIVLQARTQNGPQSREALEVLSRAYWPPLYAFLRRRGYSHHDAEDLTQGFFAHLLEAETLKSVEPGKGRFRTFLLAALGYFLLNERDKQRALKRGGGRALVPHEEFSSAEARYGAEPADAATPEQVFDRRWAWTMVGLVMDRLRREYAASGKEAVFDALQSRLTGETPPGANAAAALRLGMTEEAVKVALHRMRRRFGKLLRAQIAGTVASPADVGEELRYLLSAIGG
jgi:RNA polymerase sigma-70 factor (ECF subfamily)